MHSFEFIAEIYFIQFHENQIQYFLFILHLNIWNLTQIYILKNELDDEIRQVQAEILHQKKLMNGIQPHEKH